MTKYQNNKENFFNYLINPALLIQLFMIAYSLIFFSFHFQLPPPFFYNTSDLFMDFFNTVYHSSFSFSYAYSEWKTVYHPLIIDFAGFLDYFFVKTHGALLYREKNLLNFLFLYILIFIITSWLLVKCVLEFCRFELNGYEKSKLLIFFITCFPMLFLFSRGNLLIFSVFLICILVLKKYKNLSAYIVGLLFITKSYFVFLLGSFLIKREIKEMFKSIFFFISLTLIAILLNKESGVLKSLILNIIAFNGNFNFVDIISLNYSPFAYLSFIGNYFSPAKYLTYGLFGSVLIYFTFFLSRNYKGLSLNDLFFLSILLIGLLFPSVGGYFFCCVLPFLGKIFNMRDFRLIILFHLLIFPFDTYFVFYSHLANFFGSVNINLTYIPFFSFFKPLFFVSFFIILLRNYEKINTD